MKIFKFVFCLIYLCYMSNHGEAGSINTKSANHKSKIVLTTTVMNQSNCILNILNILQENSPLLLYPNQRKVYKPLPNGSIIIPFNGKIEFNCHRSLTNIDTKSVIAECDDGGLKINGVLYERLNFSCSTEFPSTARLTDQMCYNNEGSVIEVGFQLTSDDRFIRLYDLCHEERKGSTLYTHHFLTPANNLFTKLPLRPFFQKGIFYGNLNVDNLYKRYNHIQTMGRILGGNHEQYFYGNYKFLTRGHMTPNADYVFANEQLSTFFFVNVAPQWQEFNAGNWQNVEISVRNFANRRDTYLECFTGTWGITTLPDRNQIHRKLYLYFGQTEPLIPVPKIYYKVVIDTVTRNGIVFIGVNNPHLTLEEIRRDYIYCNDISQNINWINWNKNNITLGYSYACSIEDFLYGTKMEFLRDNLNFSGRLL